ncbi:hypothetical protein MMC10_003754 [Thelotrema lepadinum]|nr:hypothetical protein [Thelotrema lepadinum]
MGFWAAGMPWEAISRAIDSSTYEYKPVQEAQEAFTRLTRRPWDLAAEQPTMGLKCGRCATAVVTPLTTTNTIASWSTEQPGESGRGYADKGFEIECRCGQKLSHEYQRLQKFKNEMRSLFKERVPMPGTLLMISGMTDVASKATAGRGAWPMTFPNRMIQAGLGKPLARLCSKEDARVKDILDEITRALDDEALVTRAMGSKTHKPSQPERIAIRRMLSSYWDNSSRFNLDLIGAVIRQTTFTTKMHNLGWVRSPFPNPLVAHFLTRYRNYFTLLEHFPKRNVVPCLDIDLIWHTHQTLPSSYYAYSVERTGTFVDHDDKIGSTELGDSFEWTCKTYQHLFSQPYAECHCWYCAAIRESISTDTNTQPKLKSRSKLSSPFRSKFKLKPDDPKSPLPSPLSPGFPQSPLPSPSSFSPSSSSFPPTTPSVSVSDLAVQEGPHLSTHNSTPTDLSNPALYLQTMQATNRLNLHYTNACERATSEGRPLPPRYRLPPPSSRPADLSALSDPREWISPNLPDGEIHPGLYVANPLCAGAAGSCVSGGLGEGLGLGLSGKVGGGKGIADAGCGGIGGCGSGGDEGVGAGALLLLGGGGGA